MGRYCPNCGNELGEGNKFCETCGTKISPASSKTAADIQVPEITHLDLSVFESLGNQARAKRSKTPIILCCTIMTILALILFYIVVGQKNTHEPDTQKMNAASEKLPIGFKIITDLRNDWDWDYLDGFNIETGVSEFSNGSKYGIVNRDGEVVLDATYSGPLSLGREINRFKQKKQAHYYEEFKTYSGYISPTGEIITDAIWDWASPEFGDNGLVRKDGKLYFLDKSGKVVIDVEQDWPISFQSYSSFTEDVARVERNGMTGYVNLQGGFVIDPTWEDGQSFSEGLAPVKRNGKWGYIDHAGELVIAPGWDYARPFRDGIANVKKDNLWGCINKEGTLFIQALYEDPYGLADEMVGLYSDVIPFYNGFARVQLDGEQGFVDLNGKFVSYSDRMESLSGFSEGLNPVKVAPEGKWGYIDPSGILVIDPIFESGSHLNDLTFLNGIACPSKDGYHGAIDTAGKTVVPFEYDALVNCGDGTCFFKKDGLWGKLEITYASEALGNKSSVFPSSVDAESENSNVRHAENSEEDSGSNAVTVEANIDKVHITDNERAKIEEYFVNMSDPFAMFAPDFDSIEQIAKEWAVTIAFGAIPLEDQNYIRCPLVTVGAHMNFKDIEDKAKKLINPNIQLPLNGDYSKLPSVVGEINSECGHFQFAGHGAPLSWPYYHIVSAHKENKIYYISVLELLCLPQWEMGDQLEEYVSTLCAYNPVSGEFDLEIGVCTHPVDLAHHVSAISKDMSTLRTVQYILKENDIGDFYLVSKRSQIDT